MILVPVKNLVDAKQRLSPVLSPEQRFALAQAICEDVLQALARWPSRPALGCARTAGDCAGCRSSRRSPRTGGCQWRTALAEAGAKLEPQQPDSGRRWRLALVSARLGKFVFSPSPSVGKSAPENR